MSGALRSGSQEFECILSAEVASITLNTVNDSTFAKCSLCCQFSAYTKQDFYLLVALEKVKRPCAKSSVRKDCLRTFCREVYL